MEDLALTDTLNEFMSNNFSDIKIRTIKECLEYANILSFKTLGNHIGVENLNTELDNIVDNEESTGKDETIIMVEILIFNTLIVWLNKIGIELDREIIIDKGSKFSKLRDVYLTLINTVEPDLATAKFLLQVNEADYEDNAERFANIISDGIPDSSPLQYYEFIVDVEDELFDVLKNNSELVVFKNNSDIDNNLIHIINKFVNVDARFINTFIVKEVLNFDRESENVINNIQAVLSYIINTKLELTYIPYELVTAVLLSNEYNKLDGADEFLKEMNLDSLLKITDQNSLDIIRKNARDLLSKIK